MYTGCGHWCGHAWSGRWSDGGSRAFRRGVRERPEGARDRGCAGRVQVALSQPAVEALGSLWRHSFVKKASSALCAGACAARFPVLSSRVLVTGGARRRDRAGDLQVPATGVRTESVGGLRKWAGGGAGLREVERSYGAAVRLRRTQGVCGGSSKIDTVRDAWAWRVQVTHMQMNKARRRFRQLRQLHDALVPAARRPPSSSLAAARR